ncbi:MAG TPA: Crp/Fnr family transcriptional regulator [Candidatus Methylomirabilis sp.]|nr:Crp/Fnr family transcriptional regulator [Candidatus Methylomirabilis sp.]
MSGRQTLSHWYLNTFDLSQEFSRRQLGNLKVRGHIKRFGAGEVIHFAGEHVSNVCLLLSGLLELARPHLEGRELVICLLRPGEVFGGLALVGHLFEASLVRARTASEVCFFSPEEFRRLLRTRPHLAFSVIKSLEGEAATLANRVEALTFQSLTTRVAHTLLQMARAFGKRVAHGIGFSMSLTQQDLANLVGASRQHVNYVLADFRSRRLITGSGRNLALTNLDGLERIALAS